MDYVGNCFLLLRDLLSGLWGFVVQIFTAVTPLGISLLLSLIIMFIVFRYLISPFLR